MISVSHRHTRSHRKSCQPQLRLDTNKENKSGGVVGNKDQCQTTLVGARQGLCSKGEHYCATHRSDFSFASRLARNCCKCSCTLGFRLRAKHPEALIGCWRARCAVHSLVSKLEAGILAGKPLIPDLRSMHDIVNLRHGQVRHPSFKRQRPEWKWSASPKQGVRSTSKNEIQDARQGLPHRWPLVILDSG